MLYLHNASFFFSIDKNYSFHGLEHVIKIVDGSAFVDYLKKLYQRIGFNCLDVNSSNFSSVHSSLSRMSMDPRQDVQMHNTVLFVDLYNRRFRENSGNVRVDFLRKLFVHKIIVSSPYDETYCDFDSSMKVIKKNQNSWFVKIIKTRKPIGSNQLNTEADDFESVFKRIYADRYKEMNIDTMFSTSLSHLADVSLHDKIIKYMARKTKSPDFAKLKVKTTESLFGINYVNSLKK